MPIRSPRRHCTALADARTQRTAAILLDQYHGALSRAMDEIRQAIDGGRDDAARRKIDALLGRADLGRHLVQPWRVVLAGRVNVGKSSLINALAGYGRSIVHPLPGTTRDAVTVTTAIDGWPVELCDTAGLRSGGDAVERAGIQLAQRGWPKPIWRSSSSIAARRGRRKTRPSATSGPADCWSTTSAIFRRRRATGRPGCVPVRCGETASKSLLAAVARRLVPDPPPPGAAVPFAAEQIEAIGSLLTVRKSMSHAGSYAPACCRDSSSESRLFSHGMLPTS